MADHGNFGVLKQRLDFPRGVSVRPILRSALVEAVGDARDVPGQQFGDAFHRVLGDAFEDEAQVGFRGVSGQVVPKAGGESGGGAAGDCRVE